MTQAQPLTFERMVSAAAAAVPALEPHEARRRMEADPRTLLVDVRDTSDAAMGTIPGALNVPYAALPYKADLEVPETWREPALADRSRPIITTCAAGPMGALAAKLLHDMGFSDVTFLGGGVAAWKEAGFALNE